MRSGATGRGPPISRGWPRPVRGTPSSTRPVTSRGGLAACECLDRWRRGTSYVHGQRLPRVASRAPVGGLRGALLPGGAGPGYGEDAEDGPTRYGYQKSGWRVGRDEHRSARSLRSSPPGRGPRATGVCRQAAVVAQQGRGGRPGARSRVAGQVDPAGSTCVISPKFAIRASYLHYLRRLQRDGADRQGNVRRHAGGVRRGHRV
jgi:hypothetical protein